MSLVESNEPWPGKVPADWGSTRIRNVAKLSPGYSNGQPESNKMCTIVPMEGLSDNGLIDVSNKQSFENVQAGLTMFEEGDVLFAKITPCMENGKGAFVNKLPTNYAFGSTEFQVLRPRHEVNGKFLYYVTFNHVYRTYAAENMTGAAGQKRVSSRFLKDTRLFLPLLPEQKLIVTFLDTSCAALDAAVAAKRRQLETLAALRKTSIYDAVTRGLYNHSEMKDSECGVIHRIPKSWRATRLKSVADIRYGLGQPPLGKDGGIPMIRATNIKAGSIVDENMMYIDPSSLPPGRDPFLKEDEIIVVRSGAYTGDSSIVPKKYADAVAGYDMIVNVKKADPKFIGYCLLSSYILNAQILLLTTRAAQPHLNAHELGGIVLLLPKSLSEQRDIADFLDAKLEELKHISFLIESQITTLLAYRKSLIHECVTGQRRVTEADVARVRNGKFVTAGPSQ